METKRTIYGKFWRLVCTVALMLAVLTAVETPLHAFADSLPKYVSEMILLVKSDKDEAQAAATEKGYTLLGNPIYNGNGFSTFIAYKTTTNPHKAIKKIQAMNMYGDWNFSEYKTYLEDVQAQVSELMQELKNAIAEYAQMYKNEPNAKGKKLWAENNKAHYAKTILDYLYDDDTNMKIGDLFLLPVMTEEAADSAGKKKGEYLSEEHLLEILMQSNIDILTIIENALLMACSDYNNTSFLQRLGEASFNADTYKKDPQYTSAAKNLLYTLGDTQKILFKYTKSQYAYTEDMLNEMEAQAIEVQSRIETDINYNHVPKENIDIEEYAQIVREDFAASDIEEYIDNHKNEKLTEDEAKEALLTDKNYVSYRLLQLEKDRDAAFSIDTDAVKQMKSDYARGLDLFLALYNCKYTGSNQKNGKTYEYNNLFDLVNEYDIRYIEPDKDGNYDFKYELSEFFPVVAAMSKGERGMLKVGFSQVVNANSITQEDLTESLKVLRKQLDDAVLEYTEANLVYKAQENIEDGTAEDAKVEETTETELEPISIYEQVDRSLYDPDSDIAMTGLATREYKNKPEKQLLYDKKIQKFKMAHAYLGMAAGGLIISELAVAFGIAGAVYSKLSIGKDVLGIQFWATSQLPAGTTGIQVDVGTIVYSFESASKIAFSDCLKMVFNVAVGVGKAMVTMAAITAGIIIISFAVLGLMKTFQKVEDGKYIRIPRVMCSYEVLNELETVIEKVDDPDNPGSTIDKEVTRNKEGYVYYYGLKNPDIIPTTKDPNQNAKTYQIQDICNWELSGDSRQWVALYATTDDSVGAPILANSLTVSTEEVLVGANKLPSHTPVTLFGSDVDGKGTAVLGYNLMSAYNKANHTDANKLYLHYKVDEEGFERFGQKPITGGTGSVFAHWDIVAACGAGLLAGICGGMGISYFAGKRRKKKGSNA